MKQSKLNPEDVQWIKEHPKEFIEELKYNIQNSSITSLTYLNPIE